MDHSLVSSFVDEGDEDWSKHLCLSKRKKPTTWIEGVTIDLVAFGVPQPLSSAGSPKCRSRSFVVETMNDYGIENVHGAISYHLALGVGVLP